MHRNPLKEPDYELEGSQIRALPSALCVQQPCSNPGEYPEMLRKAAFGQIR
jgi:hypothetical protein